MNSTAQASPGRGPRWGGRTPNEHGQAERRRQARIERAAETLHWRLRALAWWRGVISRCPGGVVTVPTAARILKVSRSRIRELIAEGRLPVFEMPGGKAGDRYVPVDALFGVPTLMETGRPSAWCIGPEALAEAGYGVNPYCKVLGLPTKRQAIKENGGNAKKICGA